MSPFAEAMLVQRADAIFMSTLQPSSHPTQGEVFDAIRATMATCGGYSACLAACACEYGEHPESAAARMSWALLVASTLPPSVPLVTS